MGIQEKNKSFEQTAVNGLKKLNGCFPAFCEAVLKAIVEGTKSFRIEEICKSMELYAVVCYKDIEGDEKAFLLGEGEGIELAAGEHFEQRISKNDPSIKVEKGEVKEIKNTGTSFSAGFVSEVGVRWIVDYKAGEGEHVHKITANVIVKALEEKIGNLALIQDWGDVFQKCFCKKEFMARYIEAMRQCFQEIPDVDIITGVALHNYEQRESCGIVYFLKDVSPIKEEMVCFAQECLQGGFQEQENVQGIRKLLEICRNDSSSLIVSSSEEGNGNIIGVLCEKREWKDMQVVSVQFRGAQWKLRCGEELILLYHKGFYYIDDKDEKHSLMVKCENGGVPYDIFGRLFELLEDKAHHGALVIIADDAKEEVDRLCVKYGRGVKLADIKTEYGIEKEIRLGSGEQKNDDKLKAVLGMANLDGAVFFDYNGNCHGFSIILDGEAKVMGEKKRGSRYNSSKNYIANAQNSARRCAVIRSEDREKGIEIVSYDQVSVV